MEKNLNTLLSLLILIFLVTSCANIQPIMSQPTKSVQPTKTVAISTILSASQGKGVVCGYLLDDETNLPPQAVLFLSKNIAAGREDLPAMMSFSYQTNPRAEMNEEGYFCFVDVDPGIYALTLWTPPGNTEFIENQDGQDYLWIEVDPDSVIDLGYLSQ